MTRVTRSPHPAEAIRTTPHWWRLLTITLATALLVALAPTAAHGVPGAPRREVRGTIAVPTGGRPPTPSQPGVPTITVDGHCVVEGLGAAGTSWLITGVKPGRVFELTADAGSWNDDFDITFHHSPPSCDGTVAGPSLPHRNLAGDERSVVPRSATVALVTLVAGSPGAAFTYREHQPADFDAPPLRKRPTVVAVVEPAARNGYSPYHFDFVGHQHPWNLDGDPGNNLDFSADPAMWLPGYPTSSQPIALTLPGPTEGGRPVSELRAQDNAAWASMKPSETTTPVLYRFPGTKVVGAAKFSRSSTTGSIYGDNNAHGTRSASVAAGNKHGTCPECLFVLVTFDTDAVDAALGWVASQPWIDVVTNSWVNTLFTPQPTGQENPYSYAFDVVRPAAEAGQTWVWGAGNGPDGNFVVPNQTIGWPEHAADWGIRVAGVSSERGQWLRSGRPAEVAAYADLQTSAGGVVADGAGDHTGTSAATPAVAGTLAKVIQWGRDLLGDDQPSRGDGVVARGLARPCRPSPVPCPLREGELTFKEVREVVFGNVLPSSPGMPDRRTLSLPLTLDKLAYDPTGYAVPAHVSQGHGVVHGRLDAGRFAAEQWRLFGALRGEVQRVRRPDGEENWMIAQSLCRQRLWGSWTGGYYREGDRLPDFEPASDQAAIALYAACIAVPKDAVVDVARHAPPIRLGSLSLPR